VTNRRSFFRSLALIGSAAAGCPGLFIPKFEPVKWKRSISPESIVNPQWEYADYKVYFIENDAVFDHRILIGEPPNICNPGNVWFNGHRIV